MARVEIFNFSEFRLSMEVQEGQVNNELLLGSDIGRVNLVDEIVTTENHVFTSSLSKLSFREKKIFRDISVIVLRII